jgi:hypothetical protein
MNTPRPFLPSDRAARNRPPGAFERAAYVLALHAAAREFQSPELLAKSLFGKDDAIVPLVRAVTSPATTTSNTWAGDLAAAGAVGDFVASLAPLSAAARLISAGLSVSLAGVNTMGIPRRSGGVASSDVSWTAQGAPIAVRQIVFDNVSLGPMHKLATIAGLSHEVVAQADGERLVGLMLREDVAASLDASIFSTSVGTADRPPGLLAGLTTLGATSTVSGTESAMLGDLEKLAGAVISAGGSGNIVYVASPKQYASAVLRLGSDRRVTIWPSAALAAGVVVAIEPLAFVSAISPQPKLEAASRPQFPLTQRRHRLSTVRARQRQMSNRRSSRIWSSSVAFSTRRGPCGRKTWWP